MCGVTAVTTGISVLGSALGMAGKVQEQKAQREQALQQQLIQQEEARHAQMQAQQALEDGKREQEKVRLEQKALQSKQAVQYGAGNVSLDSGSALDVLSDIEMQGELDAQEIGANAQRQANIYNRQAQKHTMEAHQAGKKAQGGKLQTANTVLSGVGSITNSLTSSRSARRGPSYF